MNNCEQLKFRTSPNISGFVSALHCFLIPDSQEILGNWHALNSCPTDRRVKSLAFARLKSLARPRWKRSFVGETRFRAHTATTEPGKCWDDFAFISPHYLQLLKCLRVSFRLENTLFTGFSSRERAKLPVFSGARAWKGTQLSPSFLENLHISDRGRAA